MFDVENGKSVARRIMVEISPELDKRTELRRKPNHSGWNDINEVNSAVYHMIDELSKDERSDLLAYAFLEGAANDAYDLSKLCGWVIAAQREESQYDISERFQDVAELSRAVLWSFDSDGMDDAMRRKYPYDPESGTRYAKSLVEKLDEISDTATEYELDVMHGEEMYANWRNSRAADDERDELYAAYVNHLDMMCERYGYHVRDISDDIGDLKFAMETLEDVARRHLPE